MVCGISPRAAAHRLQVAVGRTQMRLQIPQSPLNQLLLSVIRQILPAQRRGRLSTAPPGEEEHDGRQQLGRLQVAHQARPVLLVRRGHAPPSGQRRITPAAAVAGAGSTPLPLRAARGSVTASARLVLSAVPFAGTRGGGGGGVWGDFDY